MFGSFTFATALPLLAASFVSAAQFNVTVGGGPLQFNPSSVNANPGDTIFFTFKQANHTVTQSTLANPYIRSMPVAADLTDGPFPAAQFTVQNTSPVWAFCQQTGHCAKGMVFAVNPGDKMAAFQAAAMATNGSTSGSTATAATGMTITSASGSGATATASASSPTSSSTGMTQDHQVQVGAGGLTYTPSNITAQPGDTITFKFMAKNHTATQSTFADPCKKLDNTTTNQLGFDSGFMPVANGTTTFPTYTVQVNDTKPIWVYCRQTGHCGMGMVFSVNAVESSANNFEAFQALAMQLNGTGSSTTGGASGAGGAATGTTGGASPTSTTNSAGSFKANGRAGFMLALVGVAVGLVL
ncbi:Cupredoxin [Coniophora puteana RWD-64-598 SS2]|uniref:Cupredoxin n=1 Tax=Coniophora puteana (strain RWD-64-598) TaxID=741705 RepID=A0A5M3N3N7_CONPW|nr:Cupredoxin [Coniophora puteana RWD-64-598 SS2]EIW85455.1 Cupredoxin [Coniophora puteana RWD-64-598 SS2]